MASATTSPPPEQPGAYKWHPDDLRIPIGELKQRYDPQVWTAFELWTRRTLVQPGTTVWNWLNGQQPAQTHQERQRIARTTQRIIDQKKDLAKTPTEEKGNSNAHSDRSFSQRPDAQSDRYSRRVGHRAEELLRGLRSEYHGTPFDLGLQESFGAEIGAVAAGRKPLYHDEYLELSPILAERLRRILPTGVEASERDGHLYVFRPSVVQKIIDRDPSSYPGERLLDKIHMATILSENGELLGYGARSAISPETAFVKTYDVENKRTILSFRARKELAAAVGAERARDYSFYLKRKFQVDIDDQSQ